MQDHILIVDDDQQVTSTLSRFFVKHGYQASCVATAGAMFEALEDTDFDLIILDLILPDQDGLDAAKHLQKSHDLPIIMLSARNEAYDRIVGLELGADDYVTKPYDPRELLARVRSVLRRHRRNGQDAALRSAQAVLLGGIELNMVETSARRHADGANLNITSIEFALLQTLVEAAGDVVTRNDILDRVYGNAAQITDRAIDTHIARLRRKLVPASGDHDIITTVHGKGYRLAVVPEPVSNIKSR